MIEATSAYCNDYDEGSFGVLLKWLVFDLSFSPPSLHMDGYFGTNHSIDRVLFWFNYNACSKLTVFCWSCGCRSKRLGLAAASSWSFVFVCTIIESMPSLESRSNCIWNIWKVNMRGKQGRVLRFSFIRCTLLIELIKLWGKEEFVSM